MGIPANYFTTLCASMNAKRKLPGVSYDLDFSNLGRALDLAQLKLDTQVWQDLQRYMPLDTGMLRSNTNALNVATHGEVFVYDPNTPYGHYQYEGVLYVDPVTKKGAFYSPDYGFWSRPGVAKEKTGRKLNYKQPNARAHWDEVAIENHLSSWEDLVRRALS